MATLTFFDVFLTISYLNMIYNSYGYLLDIKNSEKMKKIISDYKKKIELFEQLQDIIDQSKCLIKLTDIAMDYQSKILSWVNTMKSPTKEKFEIFVDNIQDIAETVKTFQVIKNDFDHIEQQQKISDLNKENNSDYINQKQKKMSDIHKKDTNYTNQEKEKKSKSNKKSLEVNDEDFILSDILHESKKNKFLGNDKNINLLETVYTESKSSQYYLNILNIQTLLLILINSFKNSILPLNFEFKSSLNHQKIYFKEQFEKNQLNHSNKNFHLLFILYEMISQFINNITDRMNKRQIQTNCVRLDKISQDILIIINDNLKNLNKFNINQNEDNLKKLFSLIEKFYSISIPKKLNFKFSEVIFFKDNFLKQINQIKEYIQNENVNDEFNKLIEIFHEKYIKLEELYTEGQILFKDLKDLKEIIINLENELYNLKKEKEEIFKLYVCIVM